MPKEIVARPSVRMRVLFWMNKAVLALSTCFLGEWALYGAFRCPFVVPFVSCQNCPVLTCPGRAAQFFWGFWGLWLAVGVFFGRAFCGWLCPGGLLNRLLALNPLKWKTNPQAENSFLNAKYLTLLCAILIYFVLGQPRENVPIRVGEFWPSVMLTFEHAFPMWQTRAALILGGLVLALFISAAWCRFICPMGGLLEAVKRFSIFRVYKTADCNDCGKCRRSCYMKTRPDEVNCTNCGDCMGVCPQNCIHAGRKSA